MNIHIEQFSKLLGQSEIVPSVHLSLCCPIKADGPIQSQSLPGKAVECWVFLD